MELWYSVVWKTLRFESFWLCLVWSPVITVSPIVGRQCTTYCCSIYSMHIVHICLDCTVPLEVRSLDHEQNEKNGEGKREENAKRKPKHKSNMSFLFSSIRKIPFSSYTENRIIIRSKINERKIFWFLRHIALDASAIHQNKITCWDLTSCALRST